VPYCAQWPVTHTMKKQRLYEMCKSHANTLENLWQVITYYGMIKSRLPVMLGKVHFYKMWVQFISPHFVNHWIHYILIRSCSLGPVNSLKIQWNHLAYRKAFCCSGAKQVNLGPAKQRIQCNGQGLRPFHDVRVSGAA